MQKARREFNDCSVTEWCQKAQLLLTGKCCHRSHLMNFEYFKFSEFPSRQASHCSKWGAEAHPLPSRALPSPDTDCSWHLKMLTVRSNTHLLCKCLERSSPLLLLLLFSHQAQLRHRLFFPAQLTASWPSGPFTECCYLLLSSVYLERNTYVLQNSSIYQQVTDF